MNEFKVLSGGQTGADRAALDWAIEHGCAHGGWCPRGRKAEDGVIDEKYRLAETSSTSYRTRTLSNVRDSDATIVLNLGELDGGSLETKHIAEQCGRPVRIVPLDEPVNDAAIAAIRDWLRQAAVRTLNVAGPRESKRPGIYKATRALLERVLLP